MKIAVTTASGNLGASVIKRLKQEIGAEQVIGIARTPARAEPLDVEIRKADYNNKQELKAALNGVETVLLVSGMELPDKRIQQHRNVIEAAKANGVRKIVYTSIYGPETGNAFSPVVASNRQTEEDIKQSGLQWTIGRNGIYIEPDLEYIEHYIREGGIINCAAEGKCGYTSRAELACAYYHLLCNDELNGAIYNLFGDAVNQQQLADAINKAFQLNLFYKSISVDEYVKERKAALGDFLGTVIGGIYEGIRTGDFDGISDYQKVTRRNHKTLDEMIQAYIKQSH